MSNRFLTFEGFSGLTFHDAAKLKKYINKFSEPKGLLLLH